MRIQNFQNQPTFQAKGQFIPALAQLPVEKTADILANQVVNFHPSHTEAVLANLQENLAEGLIKKENVKVAIKLYTDAKTFLMGSVPVVLAGSPVKIRGKNPPPWAIFVFNQGEEPGVTAIFRNHRVKDTRFDNLKRGLMDLPEEDPYGDYLLIK